VFCKGSPVNWGMNGGKEEKKEWTVWEGGKGGFGLKRRKKGRRLGEKKEGETRLFHRLFWGPPALGGKKGADERGKKGQGVTWGYLTNEGREKCLSGGERTRSRKIAHCLAPL